MSCKMTQSDYPKSILEFQERFDTEEACEEYLYKMRWPDGFICPVCGDTEAYYIQSKRAFQCKSNRHQAYLTTDTVMHRTRIILSDICGKVIRLCRKFEDYKTVIV